MADKRIIEQNASTTVPDDAFFIFDSALLGTFKISQSALLDFFGNATITEVTKAQYDALPDTKLTDGVLYAIKDQETSYVVDIQVDGDSVLDEDGIAELATVATSGEAEDVSYDNTTSGLTATNVQDAIDETFENAGKVDDVKVDGTSVVTNKVAEIEIPVKDVEVDGTSVVNASGVAEITLPDVPVQDVQVKTDSTYDSVVDASGNAKIDLSNKADKDGMYEELFAGNLLSDNTETDNAPYLYRQSPSGKSYVDLSVVGGTVAWNQLVTGARETSTATNLVYTNISTFVTKITGTGNDAMTRISANQGLVFIQSHKYLVSWGTKLPTGTYITTGNNAIYGKVDADDRTAGIINCLQTTNPIYLGMYAPNTTFDHTITLCCIDLTQAFGTTIADYIYSLEQAEAGSGIAWLKSYGFLTKDYYSYQSGKLESVNVSSRKVVGFNQWDEKWENGRINANTGEDTSGNGLRCKNKISVLPSTAYYMILGIYGDSTGCLFIYYDSNENCISYDNKYSANNIFNFTTPPNAHYVRFNRQTSTAVTTYNNDICINISSSRNGTYEPYTSTTYDLSGQHEVKRKFGVVDLGSLTWSKSSAVTNAFYTPNFPSDIVMPSNNDQVINGVISNGFSATSYYNLLEVQYDKVFSFRATVGGKGIVIKDNNLSSYYNDFNPQTFQALMSGVYLVYELATPTTETVTNPELRGVLKLDANNKLYYYGDTMSDIPNPQLVGSTEEFVDTRDVPIPVGGERKYYTDLKAKLEELAKIPDVPSTNGTYTLKATRSASGVAYNWISG